MSTNLCACGQGAGGYPHRPWCPRPFYFTGGRGLDAWEHEADHKREEQGGPAVDRRVCQGVGCPFGDEGGIR